MKSKTKYITRKAAVDLLYNRIESICDTNLEKLLNTLYNDYVVKFAIVYSEDNDDAEVELW